MQTLQEQVHLEVILRLLGVGYLLWPFGYGYDQVQYLLTNLTYTLRLLYGVGCVQSLLLLGRRRLIIGCESLGQISGTNLWEKSFGQISGVNLWGESLEQISGTNLWDKSMGQISGANLWDKKKETSNRGLHRIRKPIKPSDPLGGED